MSDTPRTDAQRRRISIKNEDECCDIYVTIDGKNYDGELIDADFARQLERDHRQAITDRDAAMAAMAKTREQLHAKGLECAKLSDSMQHVLRIADQDATADVEERRTLKAENAKLRANEGDMIRALAEQRIENAKLREACHVFLEARKHNGYGMDDAERAVRAALKS